MIEPEDAREVQLLTELTKNIKFDSPSGMQNRIPSGTSASGGEGLFELLAGHEETRPSGFASKANHQKKVLRINKLL